MNHFPDAVLFDLDGTLADTIPDIADALDMALTSCGYVAAGEANARAWVGKGVGELIRLALVAQGAETEPTKQDEIWCAFEQAYRQNIKVRTRLYDAVAETLTSLEKRAIKLACVTNKAAVFTEPLLASLGIDGRFESVVSGDTCEHKKPHPEPLFKACRDLNVEPSRCIMVGDSINDLNAAAAAGMKSVLVSFGYFNSPDEERDKADIVVDAFGDIISAINT
ncbi:MAG: phosphoglycolate phosphatase [Arenicellales bacterium WSBS_2016_MAG_OTU3]